MVYDRNIFYLIGSFGGPPWLRKAPNERCHDRTLTCFDRQINIARLGKWPRAEIESKGHSGTQNWGIVPYVWPYFLGIFPETKAYKIDLTYMESVPPMFIGTCCMATDLRGSKKEKCPGWCCLRLSGNSLFSICLGRGLPWRESPDVYWMIKSKHPQKDNDENDWYYSWYKHCEWIWLSKW